MSQPTQSKVAIVTGGADGIGRATASRLGERGHAIAIWDVRSSAAEDAANLLRASGIRALAVECDVTSEIDVERATERVASELGPPSVLVNSAGVAAPFERLEDSSLPDWQRVMDVYATGVFLCTKHVGGLMLKQRSGSIVTVASVAGVIPQVRMAAYSAAKAAVIRFTQVVALEWGPRGIRANTVSPGQIRTRLTEPTYASVPELLRERSRIVPLRRIGTPSDVAEVIAFLASDDAA